MQNLSFVISPLISLMSPRPKAGSTWPWFWTLYSRRIVGWAMSDSLHRQLVIDALQMALTVRQPPSGLLHHSDQGSQYASDDYQALLTKHQMVVSISTLAKKSKGEEGLPK